MKIVKLSSLSEKERKKVLEEQEERYIKGQQESKRLQQQANEDFMRRFGDSGGGGFRGGSSIGSRGEDKNQTNLSTSSPKKNISTNTKIDNLFTQPTKSTTWSQIQNLSNNNSSLVKNNTSVFDRLQTQEERKNSLLQDFINNKQEAQERIRKNKEREEARKKQEEYDKLHGRNQKKKIFKGTDVYNDNLRRFNNGYQFGDIYNTLDEYVGDTVKVGASTVADWGLNIGKGIVGVGENLGNAMTGVEAQLFDWAGNKEYAERLRRNIASNPNPISKAIDSVDEKLDRHTIMGEKGDEIAQNIGYMGALMAGETVGGPLLTNTMTFGSSLGSGLAEGYANPEATNGQVWASALGGAGIETFTENLFGMFGHVDEGVTNAIAKKIKSGLGKQIARLTAQGLGEGAEEFISYGLNYLKDRFIDKASNGKGAKFAKDFDVNEVLDQAGTAFLTSTIMGGGSTALQVQNVKKANNVGTREAVNILGRLQDEEASQPKIKKSYKSVEQENLKQQNQKTTQQANKDIDQEIKTSQNGFSQAEKTEALRQEARNKLESIKQNYDENSYNQMQEFIETAPSEKALNQVINDLNKETETKQVAPLKQKQEVQLPMKQETQNKSFEDVAFEAMNNYESNEVESPLKNRDMDSIGKQTKVNAYQYDNPQVKPYFQEMAQQMGEDLAYISSSDNRSTQKGGGTKLSVTTKAMDILHNEQGYSYNQIAQGLQNIIDDKGSENNAISKKIELVIDEQLRNGYTNALGKFVEPNQEYINNITEQYSLAEQAPQNNFKYEKTDNQKVNTLYESTSKYFDDSEKTHNMLKPMEKIIRDKGYNITFDDTIGDNVNGRIRTNENGETEITINPNSNRKGEFIIGHELTHAIETQEMVDLVKKRMEKDGELRNAVEDLKKLYGTDDINGEVLADISGQLFGNQEFINNLSIEKPSVFKRIYDTIVSLANKITGNSSEALFIKDLKNKWEKAYRENTNNIKEEQYSKNNTVEFKRDLANKFEELTGDSIRLAGAKLAGIEIRNNMRQNGNLDGELETNPYSKEAMDLYNKYQNSKKTSSYLYHATGIDRLNSIIKSGLTTGNKQNQEGVSSTKEIYLSATPELAEMYATRASVTLRVNPKFYDKFENFRQDYLGGEGAYAITNNIPPEMLQIKENNKWVNLLDSKQAKQVQSTKQTLAQDNQGRQLSKEQQDYFKDSAIRVKEIDGWKNTISPDGNLFEVYHGTNNDEFNIFDSKMIGSSNDVGWYGKGFYFAFTEGEAKSYGKNVLKAYLNIKNPFNFSKEMQSYDGVNRGDVNFDFGAFLLNLNEKFPDIAKSETIDVGKRNKNAKYYEDSTTIKEISLSKLAKQIKKIYESPNLKTVEIEDNGKTKYCYAYGIDINKYDMPQNIKDLILKNAIYNKSDVDFAKENLKYYRNLNENEVNMLEKYFNENKVDFKTNVFGYEVENIEELKENRLSEATKYVLDNEYSYVDRHMPEVYMQAFADKITEDLKKKGYDGVIQSDVGDEIVAFYPEQIKRVDNKAPTDNPDIRYSKQNNTWQDYLEKNYKSEGTTTDLRDIRLPMKEKQEVKAPLKQGNVQQNQNNNTPGENINWNEIERPENNQKFRKHYRSIIESSNTTAEAKAVAKELMGADTYTPETNKGQLAQADQRIMSSTPEAELNSLLSRAINGEKITSVDIAVGERLIQYFSKTGNKQQLQEAIQATAMAGTTAGQTVQALSMLNHQTPQGQATWIQRSVDKMNQQLAKQKGGTITTDAEGNLQVINKQGVDITDKVDLFNLTPEMIDKIMNSENQEQMYKNIDEVYEELGQQVPLGTLEKIDSWRYFSMLANPTTHIRNMVGNVAMGKMQRAKDKLAGGIEDVVSKFNPEMERTKTLRRADAKTKDFAKQDFKNMEVQSRLELNENKYNPQSRLQNARRTFKSNAMENTLGRLFNLNDKLLSAEDGIGLKAGYQKALADYITANKIDVDNITDAQLNKARNYAVQQAKEATFHQANAIASAISTLENKNIGTKLVVGGLLPFKKTPMNIAKAGVEYSPLQIAKSITYDYVNLRKGNISINQYIDNLSKGLTGTGVALVGYALANAGILKASGDEDKDKEKYDEDQGKQSYSIQIGGKTYSLDWLAPTGIPLFVGAEAYKLFNQESKEKSTEKSSEDDKLEQAIKGASNLLNAGATAINPMSEMSMISGLTNALSSYNSDGGLGKLGNVATNIGKSYINQFVPTMLGKVAKTTDEYERTTKSTAKGTLGKAVDQTINQIKNKIPGLRQTLPIKTDIWGNDVKQEVNLPLRAVNNFINPATVKNVSTDKVDMELNKLYEENHSSSLLPDILTKTVQLNKQTYRLSNKEYAEFTKNYGQTSHKLIENFIKTSDYNKLTQEQKETAISNIYSYAKEQNKMDYAKKVNETVKPSTLYTTMKEIEKNGGKQSEYLSYLAKTKGMSKESEKNKVLADSNYSNRTKEIIYTNGTGKDDNLYNNLLSKSHINMTEYLDYKDKVSNKVFSADKDKNGKTVTGSAKAKVINYLNNNITGVGNRLLIAGKSYALQNNEKQKLAQYINSIANTREERIEIYKQLDKNFYVRNGKVYMRVSK